MVVLREELGKMPRTVQANASANIVLKERSAAGEKRRVIPWQNARKQGGSVRKLNILLSLISNSTPHYLSAAPALPLKLASPPAPIPSVYTALPSTLPIPEAQFFYGTTDLLTASYLRSRKAANEAGLHPAPHHQPPYFHSASGDMKFTSGHIFVWSRESRHGEGKGDNEIWNITAREPVGGLTTVLYCKEQKAQGSEEIYGQNENPCHATVGLSES
ncbi:hypothetical protein GQ43DRAFT_436277 [Delitschia confertaspora ATCC 74209]|uniref:Uncharacterized protein n=1 Tax=Delitschia confertaspora ATCC 74209 TaxID=1513339 RepID=A0A9P4MTH3_9PLEO|nr:hypothetical protein GQ43DRAFT_436277 [Delitschia confertaspora ATCC 74209]